MKHRIRTSWTVTADIVIEAPTCELAIGASGTVPLPDDADYVDGSFEAVPVCVEEGHRAEGRPALPSIAAS